MSISVKDAAGTTQTVETPAAVGQAAMAASKPVVIASNQSAVPVSGTLAATQSGTWNIGTITTLPAVTVNGIATTPMTRGAGATDANTQRVTIANEQVESGKYEAVPSTASTTTMLGSTGAIGDFLSSVVITPLTTSPGSISIKDGSGTAILIFAGGASSVSNLVPFAVPIGAAATGVGWQVVTGSGGNVQALGIGNFT